MVLTVNWGDTAGAEPKPVSAALNVYVPVGVLGSMVTKKTSWPVSVLAPGL